MKIYVASSWRNEDQPAVVGELRAAGLEVYDFKNPEEGDHGFHWRDVELSDEERVVCRLSRLRTVLTHPRAVKGFASDFGAMRWADACVLLLPRGRSAHLEAGWLAGAGKPVVVYAPVDGVVEPELMYGLLGPLCSSFAEVLRALRSHK